MTQPCQLNLNTSSKEDTYTLCNSWLKQQLLSDLIDSVSTSVSNRGHIIQGIDIKQAWRGVSQTSYNTVQKYMLEPTAVY